MKRIVITGGHLTPALAVIDELEKRGDWEIFFIGRKFASEWERTPSVESEIIAKRGIRFIPLTAGRWPNYISRHTVFSFIKLPFGFFQAFWFIFRVRPKVILSFGGYVSVPVVLSGWLLRIPSLTHEQTTVKGLGTKFNSLFVKRIAVSWPNTAWMFPAEKVVFTGNPIRKDIFDADESLWKRLKYPPRRPLILVTGGNQGCHVVNLAMKRILTRLLERYNVFHQAGHLQALGDFELLEKFRKELPNRLKSSYHVKKYVTGNEWGTLLNKADLVISRSGANTLAELSAIGKPALLIPLPWLYGDEQMKNAQMLQQAGLAEIISQEKLTPKLLYAAIENMMRHLGDYRKGSKNARKLVKLNAAKRIADEVEKIC